MRKLFKLFHGNKVPLKSQWLRNPKVDVLIMYTCNPRYAGRSQSEAVAR
jgi:hypothetical protein